MRLRIGTRASELALTQTRWVAARLLEAHPDLDIEEIHVRSTGDRDQATPLARAGGAGVFTSELEEALLAERVDLAVHSLKDLPTVSPEGLVVCAVPRRATPWDVWISREHAGPQDVPAGGVVLTGSPRRRAQLLHRWPHLEVRAVRGNIETRIEKLDTEGAAALILAQAGLERTGRCELVRTVFSPTEMTPAPGQGALGLQTRAGDEITCSKVMALDDPGSHRAVRCERAMLNRLGAGCHMPVGGFARVVGDHLSILGVAATTDGKRCVRMAWEGSPRDPEAVGVKLAEMLLDAGAGSILEQCARIGIDDV